MRGRKPQFQASQNFHYFLKVGKIGYSFAMEKEKGETLEKREKEEVGEASIVARERWLINFSSLVLHSFIVVKVGMYHFPIG